MMKVMIMHDGNMNRPSALGAHRVTENDTTGPDKLTFDVQVN